MSSGITHLGRLLRGGWGLFMGLYLGMSAALVMGLIVAFTSARTLESAPGIEPFTDPRFAEYHAEITAGYTAQNLFSVVGVAAIAALALAAVALTGAGLISRSQGGRMVGGNGFSLMRGIALGACVVLMIWASGISYGMNQDWPGLYDPSATDNQLAELRKSFEARHQLSEAIAATGWFCGLAAFVLTPWCRRPADVVPASNETNT
ncbi:MAG: hypothetical protein AAGI37_18670 [Planctomycetota bacterium]